MKKILVLSIFCSIVTSAQKKTFFKNKEEWNVNCYLPSGEKCTSEQSKGKSINDFSYHFDKYARTWNAFNDSEKAIVVFKSFTSDPLFILMLDNKNYSAEKINEIVKSIDFDNSSFYYYFGEYEHGHHIGLKSELKSYIKKDVLDKEFILDTFNNPDEIRDSLFGGVKAICYVYRKQGVRLYLINDRVVGYDEITE